MSEGAWERCLSNTRQSGERMRVRLRQPTEFSTAKIYLKRVASPIIIASRKALETVLGRPVTEEEWAEQRRDNTRAWRDLAGSDRPGTVLAHRRSSKG